MNTGQTIDEKNPGKKVCPICKTELPILTEEGKHNFCPHSTEPNEIIDICIKCKVNLQFS